MSDPELSSPTAEDIFLEKLTELSRIAEENEKSIIGIKQNLEEIKKKTPLTGDDGRELHRLYEDLKKELLNQANITRQLQEFLSGTPCSRDPESKCPHSCKEDSFAPPVIIFGKNDNILPTVIVSNKFMLPHQLPTSQDQEKKKK